ncbi:MAG TPA: hypothetical protein VG672_29045, partial [Bryobacteraceae bacterium]|nr:hypothetical protein [Bryobacteraceae bacterium]
LLSRILAALLIPVVTLTTAAQLTPPVSKREAAVRHKAATLAPQSPISVVRFGADEEFGRFLSCDQDGFTFYDIDQKRNVTLTWAEVKKIKDGYGGYNSLRGRHTDRTKGLIVGLALAGALAGLIAAVATAKD